MYRPTIEAISNLVRHGHQVGKLACLAVLTMFLLMLTGCSVMDQLLSHHASVQQRAIAAQHRAPHVSSLKPALVADHFDIHRLQNISFPGDARIALAFDTVSGFEQATSSQHYTGVEIETALGQVADRAFKRYFPSVIPIAPQSIESAEREAVKRHADYLGFMRLVHWRQRRLVREAYCSAPGKASLSDQQRRQLKEDQERLQNLTFAAPSSPRGIQLPFEFKRCTLDIDEPRDAVNIQFWLFHLATGRIVDSGSIQGRSGWLTFVGDDPSQLLQSPMEVLAASYLGDARHVMSR